MTLDFLCYLTYKDLKPSNIAVNEDCELKVSCFFCMYIIPVGFEVSSCHKKIFWHITTSMIKIEQQENIDAITQSIFLIVTHPEKDVDSFLFIVKIMLNFKVNNY